MFYSGDIASVFYRSYGIEPTGVRPPFDIAAAMEIYLIDCLVQLVWHDGSGKASGGKFENDLQGFLDMAKRTRTQCFTT